MKYILIQLGLQLLLLTDLFAGARALARSLVFGTSLAMLVYVPSYGQRHPASGPAKLALVIVGLGILHPTSAGGFAPVAQFALYLAVLAPLFWVPRLRLTGGGITRLFAILLVYHTASATLGVLQVYFPGRFQPRLSELYADPMKQEQYSIQNAAGETTFRPMGLTDTPGGAAGSGMYAAVLGTGFALLLRNPVGLSVAGGCVVVGLASIYLSQVRSLLILVVVTVLMSVVITFLAGRRTRATIVGAGFVAAAAGGFMGAVVVGGEAVVDRFTTLIEEDADVVYHKNRGNQIESAITELLPIYPLGAGVGRYGMMYFYFADERDPERNMIWAEIQWPAWLLDGGVPLLLAYPAALLVSLWSTYTLVPRPGSRDDVRATWTAIAFALGIGSLATTFSFVPFLAQSGMEFWMIQGMVFAAWGGAAGALPRERTTQQHCN